MAGTLQAALLFAFDTSETTSLDYMDARVVASPCHRAGQGGHVPFRPRLSGGAGAVDRGRGAQGKLKPLLEDPTRLKVGQNLKYDRNVLLNHSIELGHRLRHHARILYVLNSTASRHDMDSLWPAGI